MHYLYKITNVLNNKVYIGQTVDIKKRWGAHKSFAKNPEQTGQYIHRAMAKYGIENFVFEVIDFGLNQWHADCLEENCVRMFDSRNKEHGYNLAPGGGGVGSGPNNPNYGKKQSPESIAKRVQKMIGHLVSQETRDLLRQIRLENPLEYTPEVRQHMSEAHLGYQPSEEAVRKQSESVTLWWAARNEERYATEEIWCHAPECNITGKAKYKIIDGVRYCNMHGLRLLRHGTLDRLPAFRYTEDNPMPEEVRKRCGTANIGKIAHNRIQFTPEQIMQILDDPRGNKRIAKDFAVTEKVIIRVKSGKY